jgi:aminoglycoside 2''-phosphotransferase
MEHNMTDNKINWTLSQQMNVEYNTTDIDNKINWTLSEQLKLIEKYYPNLSIDRLETRSAGCNHVLLVNDDLVFKFPKKKYLLDRFRKEKYVVDGVAKKINWLEIPQINIILDDEERYFVVCNRIEGIDYWGLKKIRSSFWNLKDTKRDKKIIPIIAADLSKFLIELHSIDTIKLQSETFDDREIVKNNYDYLVSLLKDADDVKRLRKTFDNIENFESKRGEKDKVFLHNDLCGGNFIFDPKTKKINGIIDFELCNWGDYNIEFARIFATSVDLFKNTVKLYQEASGRKIDVNYVVDLRRIRIYEILIGHAKAGRLENVKGYYKILKNLENIKW